MCCDAASRLANSGTLFGSWDGFDGPLGWLPQARFVGFRFVDGALEVQPTRLDDEATDRGIAVVQRLLSGWRRYEMTSWDATSRAGAGLLRMVHADTHLLRDPVPPLSSLVEEWRERPKGPEWVQAEWAQPEWAQAEWAHPALPAVDEHEVLRQLEELVDRLDELAVRAGTDLRGWATQWLQHLRMPMDVPRPCAPRYGSVVPLRSAPLRSAPLRSAPLRSAPLRSELW